MKHTNLIEKIKELKKEKDELKKFVDLYVKKIDKLKEKIKNNDSVKLNKLKVKLKQKNTLIEKLRYKYKQKVGVKSQALKYLKHKRAANKENKRLKQKLKNIKKRLRENMDKTKIVYILRNAKLSNQIIEYLKKRNKADTYELSKTLNYSRNYVSEVCNRLERKNILLKQYTQVNKRGRPQVYWSLDIERYI